MADATKWAPGTAYGPILQRTELYLLAPRLELHPILTMSFKGFHLNFNLASGSTGGYNAESPDRDLEFTAKNEVATLPRVTEVIVITRVTPWCTIVKNDRGVSLTDICGQLWKEYSEIPVTDAEFASLPPVYQERVKRTALAREAGGYAMWSSTASYPTNRIRRIDWLRDRVFFNGLERDDDFARTKLGFSASNIFVLSVTQ